MDLCLQAKLVAASGFCLQAILVSCLFYCYQALPVACAVSYKWITLTLLLGVSILISTVSFPPIEAPNVFHVTIFTTCTYSFKNTTARNLQFCSITTA